MVMVVKLLPLMRRCPMYMPNYVPNYVRSLLVTMVISFIFPVTILSIGLASLSVSSYFPVVATIAQASLDLTLNFLKIFGSGCALGGIVTIGATCSLVGGLFDTYTFYQSYRYQNLRNN
jgi:hypothetical protein